MNTALFEYKAGEYVVYKKKGVYLIDEIRKDKICGTIRTYYVLKSVYDNTSTVYVPVDCEALVSLLEHILSKDEIHTIIRNSTDIQIDWIEPASQRRQYLEGIVESKDLSMLISMHNLLIKKKEEALVCKTKVPAHDERMLASARVEICEAFAFSLGIDKRDVISYIADYLDNK